VHPIRRADVQLVGDQRYVRGEGGELVSSGVIGAGSLVLAPHVDGDHLSSRGRQRLEDREEVLLAAGVAGDEQGGLTLMHT
jgi:hypothetical protein